MATTSSRSYWIRGWMPPAQPSWIVSRSCCNQNIHGPQRCLCQQRKTSAGAGVLAGRSGRVPVRMTACNWTDLRRRPEDRRVPGSARELCIPLLESRGAATSSAALRGAVNSWAAGLQAGCAQAPRPTAAGGLGVGVRGANADYLATQRCRGSIRRCWTPASAMVIWAGATTRSAQAAAARRAGDVLVLASRGKRT